MSLSKVRLTLFQVEKLRCIGGAGRGSPYRITTYRGMSLGMAGLVAQYGWEASNAPSFETLPLRAWRRLTGRFSAS